MSVAHRYLQGSRGVLTMETRDRIERRSPYILILIFISLAAGIIITGYFYYQHYKENYRLEVERRLCAIVELKVN